MNDLYNQKELEEMLGPGTLEHCYKVPNLMRYGYMRHRRTCIQFKRSIKGYNRFSMLASWTHGNNFVGISVTRLLSLDRYFLRALPLPCPSLAAQESILNGLLTDMPPGDITFHQSHKSQPGDQPRIPTLPLHTIPLCPGASLGL